MSREQPLRGKSIVVTGAGRGLGRAFALSAGRHGAAVVVNDVDVAEADDVADEMKNLGYVASVVHGSVADASVAEALVAECVGRYGALDGFVNNAGVFHSSSIVDEEEERIRRIVDINLVGTLLCGARALAAMEAQGHGSLVNVTSGSMLGRPHQSAYGATKGAVVSATYAWALEFQRSGIRVNAVAPRARTRLTALVADRKVEDSQPQPDQIAPLVTFLLSDASQPITGQVMRLDGSALSVLRPSRFSGTAATRSDWSVDAVADALENELRDDLAALPDWGHISVV